jgi:acyl carrier protein
VAGWLPVRGVIHAATASVDGLIANLDPDTVRDSFEAKVRGVLQLEHHLADQPLKFFVYCSSVTALLAQKGQANYASANAFLDAHVARRRSEGQPALGVNWGGWYGAGMAVTSGGQRTIESLERRGFMGFPPATGIAALDLLLRRNATQAAVFRVDWDTFRNAYPAGKVPPLLERLAAAAPVAAAAAAARTADGTHDTTELCDRILALAPGSARSALLERHLRDILADVLRLDAAAIDPTVTLGSLGVDSLMGVELRNRCERSLGVRLSATMVWNYPTLADLTRYLSEKLALDAVQSTAAPVGAEVVAPPPAADVSELSEEEALQALLDAGAVI